MRLEENTPTLSLIANPAIPGKSMME